MLVKTSAKKKCLKRTRPKGDTTIWPSVYKIYFLVLL